MPNLLRAAALVAIVVATPAAAVSYDAFASFGAINGANGFVYGSTDKTTFTPFTVSGSCVIAGTICFTDTPGAYFGAYKATLPGVSGTILVPDDRLILHPGPDSRATYVGFQVTQQGRYSYTAAFNQQDINTAANNVALIEFYTPFGGATQLFPITTINQARPSLLTGYTANFNEGDVFGYIIDKNGDYSFDSTGVNFVVSTATAAVPEPATWAMLICGFGVVGASMRRRLATAQVY